MFKNREMTVRFKKADKPKDEPETPVVDTNKIEMLTHLGQKVVVAGALAVYGYVVVDTFRQTQVAKANNRKD